ncbi:unnamed protein product [Coffea canephora]|uniref:DH200=94 genomic scaffold, scaffold_1586 n=1 Tax=Coffea canephora TaxID=49390 RepID=A0A068VJD4_COFCA|nr:unnamed protein product [Coffea canephora]
MSYGKLALNYFLKDKNFCMQGVDTSAYSSLINPVHSLSTEDISFGVFFDEVIYEITLEICFISSTPLPKTTDILII